MLAKKAPQIRVRAICFWPFGGLNQCLWAREFLVAEKRHSVSAQSIRDWFSAGRKPPKRFEGFHHVVNVRTYLFCNSSVLDRRALFVDGSSLCRFAMVPGIKYKSKPFEVFFLNWFIQGLIFSSASRNLKIWL